MTKRALLASVLLLTTAVTALVLRQWSSSSTSPVSGDPRQMLLSCSSGDDLESFAKDGIGQLGAETEKCMHDLLLNEISSGNLERFDPALRELSRESQIFAQYCHTVLHAVGFELGQEDSFTERLRESGQGSCIFGYGHGLLEGFAHVHPEPTDEEFMEAVLACEGLGEDAASSSKGLCADGLGHAAWNSTQNPDRAAQLCDLIKLDYQKAICAGGVVMQVYAPVNEAASSLDKKLAMHAKAAAELHELCNDWSGGAVARKGCHKGAGYVYTRPLHVYAAQLLRGAPAERAEYLAQSARYMTEALTLCELHGTEGAEVCRAEVAAQIPPAAFMDDELNELLCVLLTPDRSGCPLVFKRFDNVN